MRYRRGRRKVFMLDKCWWETTRDWLLFINTDLYIFDCDPTMLQNTAWGRTEKYPSMNCLFKKVIVLSFIRLKCLTFPCFVMERCTTFGSSKISTMTFWLTLWSVEIHSVTWRIFIFWFVIGIGLALISKVCRRILFEYYYYFKYILWSFPVHRSIQMIWFQAKCRPPRPLFKHNTKKNSFQTCLVAAVSTAMPNLYSTQQIIW